MPIFFRILREQGLVHAWTDGSVSDQDLNAYRARLVANPDFSPDHDQLVECLSRAQPTLSRSAITEAALDPIYSSKSRRAIVAASDAAYGLARMFAALQPEGSHVQVYRNLPEALAWLGLASDLIAPTDPATLTGQR